MADGASKHDGRLARKVHTLCVFVSRRVPVNPECTARHPAAAAAAAGPRHDARQLPNSLLLCSPPTPPTTHTHTHTFLQRKACTSIINSIFHIPAERLSHRTRPAEPTVPRQKQSNHRTSTLQQCSYGHIQYEH
ncbi:hypothetical protein PLESTM_000788600 [Pleodorina starrii]|nr:hypothetical protein PLESTM_000788600 [Pleodorina starrii]